MPVIVLDQDIRNIVLLLQTSDLQGHVLNQLPWQHQLGIIPVFPVDDRKQNGPFQAPPVFQRSDIDVDVFVVVPKRFAILIMTGNPRLCMPLFEVLFIVPESAVPVNGRQMYRSY